MVEDEKNSIKKAIDNEILKQLKNNTSKNDELGVSQEYIRNTYDDVSKRNKFKKEYFGDKKTQKDYYTGKTVHSSSNSAKEKYGKNKYTNHSTDVDHIIPVKKVHESLKKNPFLNDEDIKRIANDESNYRMTTSKLNRQKRDNSNLKVAFNSDIDVPLEGRAKMVVDQVKAETKVTINATTATVKNASIEFSDGAINSVQASAVPLMVEGVNNLIKVANGDKEFSEAVKDMGKLTGEVALTGGAMKVVTTGATNLMKNSSTQLLSDIANSNQVTQIITVALILKDSTIKFINGEISGSEFFEEIGKKGVELVAGSIGAFVGQMLIPIPVLGAMIGSMITSIACGELFKSIKSLKDHEKKVDSIERLAASALSEMRNQREILKGIVEKELKVFDDSVSSGFNKIYDSMISNNMEGFAEGLDTILSVFNETVMFKTREEFDDFFNDENAILTL